MLHRDIKPANVMVDEHGEPKLIDFSIAKPIVLDAEQIADTATAQRFFSPLNVAPEQLRGERMGVACDVYQLGTLLYELLCGQPIFDLKGKTSSVIEESMRRRDEERQILCGIGRETRSPPQTAIAPVRRPKVFDPVSRGLTRKGTISKNTPAPAGNV